MSGPLHGVRVIDCTTVVLGPWAAQQLGDLGAEVIKVEPPEGDTTRQLGPMRNPDMGAFFLAVNRNKRSIVLDLKQESARARCCSSSPRTPTSSCTTTGRRRPSASACPTRCSARSIRAGLRRHLRLPGHRAVRRQAGLRRHHPGRLGDGLAAERPDRRAALRADHRGRQDQLDDAVRRRAGRALPPGPHRRGSGGRGADVREPRRLDHGRASLRRELMPPIDSVGYKRVLTRTASRSRPRTVTWRSFPTRIRTGATSSRSPAVKICSTIRGSRRWARACATSSSSTASWRRSRSRARTRSGWPSWTASTSRP